MRVEVAAQVREFIASLSPEPKKKLREAIKMLSQGKGDTKPLIDALTGFCRLRCGDFRVIYRHIVTDGTPVVSCEFAERREVVYQKFQPPGK